MSSFLKNSFIERWKNDGIIAAVNGSNDSTNSQAPQAAPSQTPPVVPTTFVQTVPLASSAGLAETTKQAFVEEVARQVPDLKKLLDGAALIIEDVPSLEKRLSITAKQLRASGQFDAQKALTGLGHAVTVMTKALVDEVSQEEAQNITVPTNQINDLERQRQALIQQADLLADQASTIKLRMTASQEALAKSKAKSDAGVAYLQSWQSQMENLLLNLK